MYIEADDFKFHENEVNRIAKAISSYIDLKDKVVLNIGAGQGMHLSFLQKLSPQYVYETDVVNYHKLYDGHFVHLIVEKHERNGHKIDLEKASFITTSAMDLIFKDNMFDFIVSINAFEHIPKPEEALSETIRCLKHGGYAYITLDPIYYADTGGHMFPFIPEPWGHLVYSKNEYVSKLREANASDSDINDFLYGLNRYKLDDFRKIFKTSEKKKEIKILQWNRGLGVEDPNHKRHPNFDKLKKVYSKEDLLTRTLCVLFKKIE